MNDYIETPDGMRMRLTWLAGAGPRTAVMGDELRPIGVSRIDAWVLPEPAATARTEGGVGRQP